MPGKIATALIPLLLGGLIYITYRTETLLMFSWFENLRLQFITDAFRSNIFLQNLNIPDWIKFSLPDALWLFSFTYTILFLWNFTITRQSIIWICVAPVIGLVSELGQLVSIIPGTFDVTDLILLILAALLPLLTVKNLKSKPLNS
jgi:hypothetical protein